MVKKDINQPEFVPQGVQPISRVSHCHARAARGWTMLNKHGQEPGTPQLLMMVYPPKVADERSMDLMCIIYIYTRGVLKRYKPSILGYPHLRKPLYTYYIKIGKEKKTHVVSPIYFDNPMIFFPSTSRRIIASADGRGLVGTCDDSSPVRPTTALMLFTPMLNRSRHIITNL